MLVSTMLRYSRSGLIDELSVTSGNTARDHQKLTAAPPLLVRQTGASRHEPSH